MTSIPWIGWLKPQIFIAHNSRGWKSKLLANLLSGKNQLLGLQVDIFLLCPLMVEGRGHFSYKGTNLMHQGTTLMS
jgi:hypothetical protein